MQICCSKISQKAFTLVELAIVIVIIGLLLGGVLVGQQLITQSEIQTLLKNVDAYKSAAEMYRGKYGAYPGDDIRAYDWFGNNCDTTPSNCNGNGNGLIENTYNLGTVDNEVIRFWQHLNMANLIKGRYLGQGNMNDTTGNVNPKTPFKEVGMYVDSGAGAGLPAGVLGKHYFMTGRKLGSHFQAAYLEPSDAYALDLKIDDGKPYEGLAGTYGASWSSGQIPNCASGTSYNITYSGYGCHMLFGW